MVKKSEYTLYTIGIILMQILSIRYTRWEIYIRSTITILFITWESFDNKMLKIGIPFLCNNHWLWNNCIRKLIGYTALRFIIIIVLYFNVNFLVFSLKIGKKIFIINELVNKGVSWHFFEMHFIARIHYYSNKT